MCLCRGHAAGDEGVVSAFLDGVGQDTREVPTSGRELLESHLIAFAVEKARVSASVVTLDDHLTATERRRLLTRIIPPCPPPPMCSALRP